MSKLQTNAIRHLGSSVDNMTLDSSGRVLMPQQPAFRAGFSSSGDQSTTSGTTIPYDAKSFDIGGNYDTSSAKFTAPIAGRYVFSANLYLTQSAGAFTGGIGIKVNNSYVLAAAGDGARVDCNVGSGAGQMTINSCALTLVLNLAANDYVQVYGINYSGGAAVCRYYKGTSFWEGYLIG
jgi:hypothetical protein